MADLERKYREELHANEIVLLAYYIAAVNIEEAYRGRRGEDSDYEPFSGIVLTDTFNLNKKGEECYAVPEERGCQTTMHARSANRSSRFRLSSAIRLGRRGRGVRRTTTLTWGILNLGERIEDTYAASSSATLKRYLYDSYKLAIRWASDRIKETGIIAFVSNASWIDGNGDAGIRACLAEEFSSIYVLHLRGNQRTQGELSRREGGKVFGSGSRAPVAITISGEES